MSLENLRKLTDQHRHFCECYLIHFDASRAARESGFSALSAQSYACKLLKDPLIKEHIRKRSMAIISEIKEEQVRIFRELMKVGHSKIRDLYNSDGSLKRLDDWPEDIASCVSSIKQKIKKDGTKSLEVKLWNKNQALDVLSRVTGLQTSELKIALPDNVGALYFPSPKEIGAPVDERIIARDEKLQIMQEEKRDHGEPRKD